MARTCILLALSAVLLTLLAACAGPPRTVEVTLKEFSFSPAQISAKPGEKLHLILKNAGMLPHSFVSADLKVNQDVAPGQTAVVDATAPSQAGRYAFACGVPGHEAAGMRGTLTVK